MNARPQLSLPTSSIVDPTGQVAVGVYDCPFEQVNLDEARLPLGPFRWGRRLSRFRYKEWQHFVLLLMFEPRGERSEDLQLGLVRSVFHQPYGTFSGTIRRAAGLVRVKNIWGVCEDHDAKW